MRIIAAPELISRRLFIQFSFTRLQYVRELLGKRRIFGMTTWQLCELIYHNTFRVSMPRRNMEPYATLPRQAPAPEQRGGIMGRR
jgi:hypothetical protein